MQINKPQMVQLLNFFYNSTKNSHKKMLSVSTDHLHKLKEGINDTDIAPLYALMEPVYADFQSKYSAMMSNYAYYQGKTIQLENLLTALNRKVKQWDVAVQTVYLNDTAEYKMLFPNKRKIFQSGAYATRLEALRSLERSLSRFDDLAAILQDVQDFRKSIIKVRSEQQATAKKDKDCRIMLEAAHLALAKVMQRIFGMLMFLYGDEYSRIEAYYTPYYFHRSSVAADIATQTVEPQSQLMVMQALFNGNEQFEISNKSQTTLGFFLTDNSLSPPPADMLWLPANTSQLCHAATLGGHYPARLLMVANVSDKKARFSVHLLS